jgi:hypothetical protein
MLNPLCPIKLFVLLRSLVAALRPDDNAPLPYPDGRFVGKLLPAEDG